MAQAEKEHKLDIFRVLAAADTKDRNFYAKLDDVERKSLSPLVAMRWLSGIKKGGEVAEYYLRAVNDAVNVRFWELREHPEMQYRLMATVGIGARQQHEWINMPRRAKGNKLYAFLLGWYPSANDAELELLLNQHTSETFRDFAMSCGINDDEANEVIAEYKKLYGNRTEV